MHALRTAIFTAKGLKRFMKDGYAHHAQSYDAKCVRRGAARRGACAVGVARWA
jgi:hypothetical protein